MQYFSAWGERGVLWPGVWCHVAERRFRPLRVTSRNSNGHNLKPLPLFTDAVDFRMLCIYIISIIHLPTLNIIFLSPWGGHAT